MIPLRREVYHSSLTSASTARFDFVVTMLAVGKIDEDTVDCLRFVAFEGASSEDSSSSFNLEQLTKRIHVESDIFDEEEAQQAQRKDRRRQTPFNLESPIGSHSLEIDIYVRYCCCSGWGGGGALYALPPAPRSSKKPAPDRF